MKWTAFNPLRCQGLALRLDVSERDPRGKYMVKYGPEMENSTKFDSDELKKNSLMEFTDLLLTYDMEYMKKSGERFERIDENLKKLLEEFRDKYNYIARVLLNWSHVVDYKLLEFNYFPKDKVLVMKLVIVEKPEVEYLGEGERQVLWLSHHGFSSTDQTDPSTDSGTTLI